MRVDARPGSEQVSKLGVSRYSCFHQGKANWSKLVITHSFSSIRMVFSRGLAAQVPAYDRISSHSTTRGKTHLAWCGKEKKRAYHVVPTASSELRRAGPFFLKTEALVVRDQVLR